MKYQVVNMSGQVVKVFRGVTAQHEARTFVHIHQSRLWIRSV